MIVNGILTLGLILLILFVLMTSLATLDVLRVYEDGTHAIYLGDQGWGFVLPWTPLVTEGSAIPTPRAP